MKTLLIIAAILLALSSCSKEMPTPDPDYLVPPPDAIVYTSPTCG
jgi:hypothetical protein